MISFNAEPRGQLEGPSLQYRRADFAFDVNPKPRGCFASLTLNEVQLEIDSGHKVLCVTGYCPSMKWANTKVSVPPHSPAALFAEVEGVVERGTGRDIADRHERWPVFVNHSGWICVGNPNDRGDCAWEFSVGCVAVLRSRTLVALWLHPVME